MIIFLLITFAHFAEHLVQMAQLYVLKKARNQSLGLIGSIFPALMKSELLHFFYALIMLIGLYYLGKKYKLGKWWRLSCQLQSYHFIEHLILLIQAIFRFQKTGIGGLIFPRIELHFFYNLMVLIPMLIGLKYFYHKKR